MLDHCQDCSDPRECLVCARRESMTRHPAGKSIIDFDTKVLKLAGSNVNLLLSKHKDYGPKNISQSPGGALNGLRVRMHDKLARINHLLDSGATPEHEALADSFLDLANYALIAQLVLRGEWPNE